MDYVESLLEEYFDVSRTVELEKESNGRNREWIECLLAIEEEICWEFNVPPTNKFRDLFRLIPKEISKENYVSTSIKTLSREKARYFYRPNESFFNQSKAA